MKKTLLFLLFSIFSTAQTLDTAFDTDGVINNPISNVPSVQNVYDGILQPDGKMIYVGRYIDNVGFNKGFVVRHNTDGTKDTSFSNGGGFSILGTYGFQSVTLQIDGKIIVVGTSSVYRLTANGIVDLTFNSTGYKTISLAGQNMNIKCVSVQSDNKIVVSGFISNGTNNDVAVARLNTDGTFDTTFDTDGIYTFISSSIDNGFTHKIQADGKIVIVGDTGATTTAKNFLIVRLNINGTLDTSFNSVGYSITDFSSSVDYARDIQILPDNSILVLGSSAGNVALSKYTSTGVLDAAFNATGKKTFSIPVSLSTSTASTSLHDFPKFKVLSTGEVLISSSTNTDYTVLKLNTAYNLNTTFGTNGVFTSNSETDLSTILQVKSNGNIIIGGISYTTAINSDAKIKEVELTGNGVLITNVTKSLFLGVDKFITMKKNANGDFFVIANLPVCTLLKYNSAGQLDTSFGVLGKVSLPKKYTKIVLANNGKIVLGGFSTIGMCVLNSTGTYDTNFNGTGIIANMESYSNFKFTDVDEIYITSDNKLLIGTESDENFTATNSNGRKYTIFRMNFDGTIDASYGVNGCFISTINPSDLPAVEYTYSILEQSDGKHLFVGLSYDVYTSNLYNSFVVRLNPDGTRDNSYGNNAVSFFLDNNDFIINKAVILPDNKLLLNYYSNLNTLSKTVKLNTNGSIDTTFGVNGVIMDIVNTENKSLCLQLDGKYLKAGERNNQFSISRYNADGSVDTTFGTNGELNPIVGYVSSITDILLQPDGKIVVGGSSLTSDNQLAVLARFTNTVLGILDFSTLEKVLSIYPNPIETSATFEFTLNISENITVELYDVQGKLVQTIAKNKVFSAGSHNLPIELQSNLNSGNYLLKLTTQTGSQSIQIIKK